MKISLAFVHRYLISYSANWTGLPGRLPRTKRTKRQHVGPVEMQGFGIAREIGCCESFLKVKKEGFMD